MKKTEYMGYAWEEVSPAGKRLAKKIADEYKEAIKDGKDGTLKSMIESMLEKIMSETKARKMHTLYSQETSVRGHNVFALYSAFTNYSTYGDERNGFTVKDTKGDTKNVTMLNRELEVNKWIATPQFKDMLCRNLLRA